MAREENANPLMASTGTGTENADVVAGTVRRPYQRPTLRRLGSVRELTLGGSNGMAEGGGTFFIPGQTMMG